MKAGVVLGTLGIAVAVGQGWCGSAPRPPPATAVASTEDPALPGIPAASPALMERLLEALRSRGSAYEPRTRHKNPDGAPKYVNRLILETSPYLLQHAHNPVNWYPWGDEAFARAAREKRPVLMSIGYSTCHWCHVMERESFEDEEIARFINEHFVAIKVDREERPDVDDVYMSAVQQLTGSGGWPMTLVLTADRRPFFGGTYFPARDGDRGAKKGFLSILRELAAEQSKDPDGVVARASQISEQLRRASAATPAGAVPGPAPIEAAVRALAASFDATWGGFGRAPKFPRPVTLELLLRHHRRTKDSQSLAMVTRTLEQMAAGGIYDQVGGGFHRYSTDGRWLVPHFEKMLYDNAQLVPVYLEAFQLTKRPDFEHVARETLEYVRREMTSPEGGFYSATDADSPAPTGHDEEGLFFTWTPSELAATLGPELARVANGFWGVTAAGNFEGRSILHRPRPDADVARALELEPSALSAMVADARTRLYAARSRRKPPLRDDKIVTAWNGLMISAFARGAFVLGDRALAEPASRAARFILKDLRNKDGRLSRTYKDGKARHPAVLDDYAFLIQGLLDLFEATSDAEWLEAALALQGDLDAHFSDPGGGYFGSAGDAERLLTREKPSYDGAEPAGNSVALTNLLRLAEITGRDPLRAKAEKGLGAFAAGLTRAPTASPKMLSALERYLDRGLEIAIIAPSSETENASLVDVVRSTYLPNRSLVVGVAGAKLERSSKLVPWLEGKRALKGRATAFVCDRGKCDLPASDPKTLARQLAAVRPLAIDEAKPAKR